MDTKHEQPDAQGSAANLMPSGHRRGSREAVLHAVDSLPVDRSPLSDDTIESHIQQMRQDWD